MPIEGLMLWRADITLKALLASTNMKVSSWKHSHTEWTAASHPDICPAQSHREPAASWISAQGDCLDISPMQWDELQGICPVQSAYRPGGMILTLDLRKNIQRLAQGGRGRFECIVCAKRGLRVQQPPGSKELLNESGGHLYYRRIDVGIPGSRVSQWARAPLGCLLRSMSLTVGESGSLEFDGLSRKSTFPIVGKKAA